MNNSSIFSFATWIISIVVTILMPVFLFMLANHTRKAEQNATVIKESINSLVNKLDAHILWHLGKREDK